MFLIATLPNEVLLEIFECYIDLPNQLKDFHGDTRFVIAGVCQHWRTLLVEAPLLWKAITIDDRSFLPHPLSDPNVPPWSIFLRTSLALHWSGYQPLNVTIKLPNIPTPTFNSNHTALIARLLHHAAARIASLEVSGDAWEMNLQALRWLLNTPMPLLHTFTHIVFEEFDVSEEIQYENFTSHSNCLIPILQYPFPDATTNLITVNSWGHALYPRLESVEISGAPYKIGLLPTIGLKKLELRNQPVNACPPHALIRDILSFCADTLEDLSLSGFLQHPSDGRTRAVPNPVVLYNLSTLTFGYQASDEVAKFLPYIRTPALRRLEVTDDFMSFRAVSQARKHYTDNMLNALIRYLPLNQLERLILGHVVFKDEIAIPDVDAFLLEEKVAGKDVPFTLRFLSSLSSLEHLEIWLTDDRFLSFVNYPRTPSFRTDGRGLHDGAMQLPSLHHAHLPSLRTLHLFGDPQEASVLQFLEHRVHAIVREKPLNVVISNFLIGTLDERKLASFESLRAALARGSSNVSKGKDVAMG